MKRLSLILAIAAVVAIAGLEFASGQVPPGLLRFGTTGAFAPAVGDCVSIMAMNSSGQVVTDAGTQCGGLLPYTIGTLPTCNSAAKGLGYYVTNGVTSPTYLATVSTTGSTVVPVFCNGTNWVYNSILGRQGNQMNGGPVTPPVFNYDNFIEQFPAFGAPYTEAQIRFAWNMGSNWMETCPAWWGVYDTVKLQMAADLMGAVVCYQLYGTAGQLTANGATVADEAPGAIESATEGSVSASFQLPAIGTSAFSSMLLASPPYGRMLLALLQVQASIGPYISSCRGFNQVPP